MAGRRYRLSPLSIRDTSNSPYAPLASATVTVYKAGGVIAATCYADTTTGTPLVNSQTTTNSAGYFEFFIDSADYTSTQRFKIKISKTGYTDTNYDNLIVLPDLSGITDPWVDVRAYGAVGDGVTDDTTAIQNAINYAATNGLNVYVPRGYYKYTKLYFHYDAALNPGWPNAAGKEGKIKFYGDGTISTYNLANTIYKRTVLESTDATGPGINILDTGTGYRLTNLTIEGVTLIANNTTQVVKMLKVNHMVNLNDVWVYQKGAGGGVLAEDIWVLSWRDVYIYGAGKTVSGIGLILRNPDIAGGNINLWNVNTNAFDKGWEIGNTAATGSAIQTVNCFGCQASTSQTYGVFVGWGAKNVNWIGSYIESVQNTGHTGVGMVIKFYAENTNVSGSFFSANDIQMQNGNNSGTANEDTTLHTKITGNRFDSSRYDGLKLYTNAFSQYGTIEENVFSIQATYTPSYAINLVNAGADYHGLWVRSNHYGAGFTTNISDATLCDVYAAEGTVSFNLATPFVKTAGIYAGANSPESVVTAVVGSLYLRSNGGASTTLYVKESGTGNTGWVAK